MGQVRSIAPHLRALGAPEPLRALPAWLIWRMETYAREPKPRKVPYYVSGVRRYGQQGSPSDRAQLTTFAAARDAAARMGYDGVGFALLPDWQVTALDFDYCVAPDGSIPEDVTRVVQRTYAEYSPSGQGIRAFLMGNLGNHKSIANADRYGVETFSSSGFVTFTGNILPHVDVLGYEDRVAPVDSFTTEFCERRFGATSSSFDPDDFMLGHAPRLGLTVERMQELLEVLDADMGREDWIRVGMALHHECEGDDTGFDLWNEWSQDGGKYPSEEALRDQWDSFERRKGTGRRQVTMATVIKMVKDLGQPRPSIVTAEQLAAAVADRPVSSATTGASSPEFDGKYRFIHAAHAVERPPVEWFIKNIVPKADLGIIFGASGSGKTFVALDMALAMARGAAWRSNRVNRKLRVAYIAAEGGGGFGQRIKANLKHNNIDLRDVDLSVMYAAPNFMDKDDISEVLRAMNDAGPFDVVFVDTFAQVTPGANENAADDMGHALANVRALRIASGAMVVLVHHSGKDATKGARGWSGLKAAADFQIEVLRHDNGFREIHLEKLKDGEDGKRFGFELKTVEMGFDEDGDAITSCIVVDADAPKAADTGERKGVRRRGRIENHVLETMAIFGTADTVKLQALVDQAVATLPAPEADARDTRRQSIMRAIQTLSKEKDGPLQVKDNIVIFFE